MGKGVGGSGVESVLEGGDDPPLENTRRFGVETDEPIRRDRSEVVCAQPGVNETVRGGVLASMPSISCRETV